MASQIYGFITIPRSPVKLFVKKNRQKAMAASIPGAISKTVRWFVVRSIPNNSADPIRCTSTITTKSFAKSVNEFKIHPLSQQQADTFAREWHRIQGMFVDDPDGAVAAADRLVTEVMEARGYPIEDFDTRAADLSVEHPRVVENYRVARALAVRRGRGEAGTEELRQAVVNYRALFD